MKSLFRLFIVLLSVVKLFDSKAFGQTTTNSGVMQFPMMQQPDACYAQLQNYNSLRSRLADKCAGLTESNCITEAKKCAGDEDNGNITRPLMNTLQNTLMAGMTGGYPTMGAQGPDTFKCLPTSRLEQVRTQMEKLRTEAQKNFDKAEEFKRKVEDEAKDINKSISDMKKDAINKAKERQNATTALPTRIQELRDKAGELAESIQDQIDGNSIAAAKAVGEVETLEAQRGALYVNTVGKCADELVNSQNAAVLEYDKKLQVVQENIANENDINKKEKIKYEFLKLTRIQRTKTEGYFKAGYAKCLNEQTIAYNANFKALTSKMAQTTQEIERLNKKNQGLYVKLKNIPKSITEGIKALNNTDNTEKQAAANETFTMQQEIQQSIALYTDKATKANQSFQQAQIKQNISQMQQMTNQSLFHMNTFGDAAPWLEGLERTRKEFCDMCGSLDPSEIKKRNESLAKEGSGIQQMNTANYRSMCNGSSSSRDSGSR